MRLPPVRRLVTRRAARRRVLPAEVGGECVFCAIVAGRAEASLVGTDDGAVAFLDLQPAVVGHALVVPRRHAATLADLTPDEGAAVWELGRRVAAAARTAGLAEGVNLFLADGAAAGQEVWHVHLHVLPRTAGDGLRLDGAFRMAERPELDATATRLRDALATWVYPPVTSTFMTSTAARPEASTGSSGQTFDSLDPRDGSVIASHPVHTADEVRAVVDRARRASTWWADLGFDGRRDRLGTWRRLLIDRTDELAALVSRETGKPLDDARLEVVLVIDHLHWAGKHAKAALGRKRFEAGALMVNHRATIEYRPLGVIGVLGPWNYPVFTPMGSIGYALAAGNAVVFKPSELTPGVGQWLADSFAEVIPEADGLFGLVTGEGETGAALCRSGVDKIAFTGSTATAKKVMATCAETLTPILAECGGKDALLVDEDADLDDAAAAAVWGAMSNAGQTCIGIERVYVVDSVAEAFLDKVAQRAATIRPGGEARSIYGPITMPSQIGIIAGQIDDALTRGGRAVVGGRDSVRAPYVDPVVLADVPEDSSAVTDETFGPTLVVNRVRDLDEAVERANASRYGLGGAVFAKKRGYEAARKLRCGMVSVNGVIAFAAMPSLPFGGVGDSGFGRIHGRDGLREFTRVLAVSERRFKSINVMTFERPSWVVKALSTLAGLIYRRNR